MISSLSSFHSFRLDIASDSAVQEMWCDLLLSSERPKPKGNDNKDDNKDDGLDVERDETDQVLQRDRENENEIETDQEDGQILSQEDLQKLCDIDFSPDQSSDIEINDALFFNPNETVDRILVTIMYHQHPSLQVIFLDLSL